MTLFTRWLQESQSWVTQSYNTEKNIEGSIIQYNNSMLILWKVHGH